VPFARELSQVVNASVLEHTAGLAERLAGVGQFRHVVIDGFLAAQLSGTVYKRP